MKIICAWCQNVIREDDFSGLPDSHGICQKCRDPYYPRVGTRKRLKERIGVNPVAVHWSIDLKSTGPFCHYPKVDIDMGCEVIIDSQEWPMAEMMMAPFL